MRSITGALSSGTLRGNEYCREWRNVLWGPWLCSQAVAGKSHAMFETPASRQALTSAIWAAMYDLMNFRLTVLALFFALLAIAGCDGAAEDDTTRDSSTDNSLAIQCTDPRPQICTREYRPVCGLRDTGIRCITTPCPSTERKTYSNACSACSDPDVLEYTPGECDEDIDAR